MKFERLSGRFRIALAASLVSIQFSALAALGIIDLTRLGRSLDSYLTLEVASILLGLLVIVSAGVSLRPSLRVSPIPRPNSPLVGSGIYKWVRHPMYLGVILIGFGLAGFADSSLSWAIEITLILDLNIKARFEDALLREIHPGSLHYQLHVSRLIPCVGSSCKTHCVTDL